MFFLISNKCSNVVLTSFLLHVGKEISGMENKGDVNQTSKVTNHQPPLDNQSVLVSKKVD